MPFEIVRNDIVNMQVDAIVNTANPRPLIGYGTDHGIHKKAGPNLLKARKRIGRIRRGQAAITPAFDLDARFVIHTVGPVWKGGTRNEEELLASCYRESLKLAMEHSCESIAFPLISTGSYGFPKPLALQIAVREFSSFLMEHDMKIYLVVFNREAFELSEKLFQSVASYIDENYIREKILDEYGITGKEDDGASLMMQLHRQEARRRVVYQESIVANVPPMQSAVPPVNAAPAQSAAFPAQADFVDGDAFSEESAFFEETAILAEPQNLEDILQDLDAGFSETLLQLIDRTGKKDSDIYKKANVDRKLFSKIRNNMDYKPSKATALAFAIALELTLEETKDFLARAGFALSHSSKFDVIVEYFIINRNYDIFELNEVLFAFDQPLIGA